MQFNTNYKKQPCPYAQEGLLGNARMLWILNMMVDTNSDMLSVTDSYADS